MKLRNVIFLSTGLLALCGIGCSHDIYDPSLKPEASASCIKAVSLETSPAKPIAPNPWKVTMKVKNVGGKPLENIGYAFLIGGKEEPLGKGLIPRLNPGETVNVVSQTARVEQGNYHVEGRVFPQNKVEPEFNDRIDNWLVKTVVVAQ